MRYFFDLVEDDSAIIDDHGIEFREQREAEREAARCAEWMAVAYQSRGARPATGLVRVRDAAGQSVLEVAILEPAISRRLS